MPYYPLRAMEHHFVVPKCPKSVKISPSSQVLPWPFLGAMPNPSLGCFLLVGCCLSCLFFFAFFGGRCQIPRLGVSCSSGAAFRAWVLLLPFLGAMPNPSLGCFLLVGCCLSCLGSFFAFFGGRPNPSLGCFLLVGCLLNGWSWDQSI